MYRVDKPKTGEIHIRLDIETVEKIKSMGNVSEISRKLLKIGLEGVSQEENKDIENVSQVENENVSQFQNIDKQDNELVSQLKEANEKLESRVKALEKENEELLADSFDRSMLDLSRLNEVAEMAKKTPQQVLDLMINKYVGY